MMRRSILAVAVILCGWLGAQSTSRAEPAVNGIIAGSVPILIWSLFADPPEHRNPDLVTLGGGFFDAVDDEDQAALFKMEYRSDFFLWRFKPFVGVDGTSDGGAYAYAGLRVDAYFGRRLVISPNVAPAVYYAGDGKNLGSAGVLRSGIDVSYRFDNESQLGVGFHHMSHGKVFSDLNPGTETVTVTYSVPMESLF
ncbi:MAG: acyloxyacyl hydrolase [Rhodospirillaceae bacterium]|jgi:lipid A 3-O-deacylase|nr:acyloxyacyl hydrolase [Rhodospirillaceae bacterium]